MKYNYTPFLLFTLRRDMEKNEFNPSHSTRFEPDGKEHEYDIFYRGKKRKAHYEVKIHSSGRKWPMLTANYGDQHGNHHFCKVSIYELRKNKTEKTECFCNK